MGFFSLTQQEFALLCSQPHHMLRLQSAIIRVFLLWTLSSSPNISLLLGSLKLDTVLHVSSRVMSRRSDHVPSHAGYTHANALCHVIIIGISNMDFQRSF